jgi:MerR family transcriptional regulator, mercuric resistance operon regulatory protein
MDAPLSIGTVAAMSGLTPDAIRYYERRGLLPAPARTSAGYRRYSADVVRRLALIRSAQRFGFSLSAIAGFLRMREAGGRPCEGVRAAAQRMLDAMDVQLAELSSTRMRMRRTLREWDRTLARTPPGRQARLLERLPATTAMTARAPLPHHAKERP